MFPRSIFVFTFMSLNVMPLRTYTLDSITPIMSIGMPKRPTKHF